jgi:fructose-1,6-bisphosphatase/inositol monophosphatase family enzyme
VGIGLLHEAEPVEGYLHFPLLKESYAFRDGVALRNGRPIEPSAGAVAADCRNLMITAIHSHVDVRRVQGFRLHNLGSNLYHMLALATGRCEAIITGACYLWDLAPALPFTRALGYVERFLDGSPLVLADLLARPDFGFPVRQPLIVGPADLVSELLKTLRHQQV